MERTAFRAVVKSMTADKSRVEVRLLVDLSDVTAHEGLVAMRGREALVTLEPVQREMELEYE